LLLCCCLLVCLFVCLFVSRVRFLLLCRLFPVGGVVCFNFLMEWHLDVSSGFVVSDHCGSRVAPHPARSRKELQIRVARSLDPNEPLRSCSTIPTLPVWYYDASPFSFLHPCSTAWPISWSFRCLLPFLSFRPMQSVRPAFESFPFWVQLLAQKRKGDSGKTTTQQRDGHCNTKTDNEAQNRELTTGALFVKLRC
jgi:hypothetical protein